jgi:NAD(P)-dependent dehydrogenase (short-subunit alcohol dehydrogenase family)
MDDHVTVAVVTGGNRGIGYAVAEQLAGEGCRVVILARDLRKGEAARSAVERRVGGDVRVVEGDLSSVRGVRAAAEAVREACPRLDVLVHNAGVWPSRCVLNEDGLEQSFATNHLAPFLLNHELEPLLIASRARVVQVSAGLYTAGKVDPDRTPQGLDFHPLRTYADTKLCNVALVPKFAQRWLDAGVTINAVHPGVVRTGLGDRKGPLGLLLKAFKLTWKRPSTGAKPVVRLALSSEVAGQSGRYFNVMAEAPLDIDDNLTEGLWAQAAELTGVHVT